MDKIIPHCCPRCNSKKLYKYGKDKFGNQKYQCRVCKHQFAPGSISSGSNGAKPLPPEQRKYPSCPICGKAAFLHHDYDDYSKETLIKFALPKRFEIWYNNTIKAMVVQDNEARNIYRH